MSCYEGSSSINDSLVLSLDIANSKCYNQAENLLTYSNDLSAMNAARCSKTLVSSGGPLNNAYTVMTVTDNTTGNAYLYDNTATVAAGSYVTQSWYIKDIDNLNLFALRFWSGTGRAWTTDREVQFSPSTSSITVTSGSVFSKSMQYVGNGWYRLSITAIADQAGYGLASFYIVNLPALNSRVYVSAPHMTNKIGPSTYTPTTGSIVSAATTTLDLVNTNNATLVNNPLYSSDNGGVLNYLTASATRLSFANSASVQFLNTDPYTLEAWVYPTTNPGASNWSGIIHRESNAGAGRDGYSLYFYGSATTTTYFYTERFVAGVDTQIGITLDSSISVNAWSHLIVTYNGTTLTLYRNGVSVASASASGNITNTTATLEIGALAGNYFSGKIAVSKIYNRALTATEVTQNFNALRGRFGI